jgi:hypothetical protein
MSGDPFGTEELRHRVLEAWRASPARFRADANVEDDLALTGYRDRVVVELAQNAADAAARAGAAGTLTLELAGDLFRASNTGTPLDAAGVESLSVARASAKLDERGAVGRFGVGFAAVLAVSDEPTIASTSGAVRWSRREALASAARLPELEEELSRRGDRVPVLRLPFPAQPLPAGSHETVVTLPLRGDDAVGAVREQLEAVDPTLLLALPALARIVVRIDGAERVLRSERDGQHVQLHDGGSASRWALVTGSGQLPAELLADRPAEEHRFDTWGVTWALPVDAAGRVSALPDSVTRLVRAPTALDDGLTLGAVLIASYPLDSSRRRVTTGALADAVTAHAADLLVQAIADRPPDPSVLRLVPTGFPDGSVDGALHHALLDRLGETPWLPTAADPDIRQRPREAVLVPDQLVGVLSDVVPSSLPAGWSQPELLGLGVQRPSIADLVEALATVRQPPPWWRRLYAALDETAGPGPGRDALGGLPVPLTDGTVAIGPRGVAMLADDGLDADLSAIGLRVIHPGAAHPLLASLGAVVGAARELLAQPQVRAAVESSYDDEDPGPIAAAVLALLAAGGGGTGELPWLADLALTDDTGDWRPAGELLLPGGLLAEAVSAESDFGRVAQEWIDRWGPDALLAAGVLDAPAVLREVDAVGPTHDLDDEASWWGRLSPDSAVEEFVAVRDLEQVRPDALPGLLPVLAQPPLRAAVVEPAVVTTAGGGRSRAAPYTAWWLSSRPVVAGQAPRGLRLGDSDALLGSLYDVAPALVDAEFMRALGVLRAVDDADPDDLLDRLADPGREVGRDQLRALDRWLSGQPVTPPGRVRAVRGGDIVVVDAGDAVIVDAPDLLPLLGKLAVVPVAVALAEALAARLDVSLASELARYEVVSTGAGADDAVVHDVLRVRDVDGVEQPVAWRYLDGHLHVDRGRLAFGLGRGRAWRDGRWHERHRRSEESSDPDGGMIRDGEDDFDIDPEE